MAQCVGGELKDSIRGKLFEIERQLRQKSGYPYDPAKLNDFLQAIIEGRFAVAVKSLLAFLGTIALPATKKFVAKDNFQKGNSGIGWMSDNFKAWFLGKTENQALESSLRYHRLTENSLDAPILAELGDKAETTLANLFHLLSLQAKGQNGVLLTNGYANIFYIKDASGELRAVGAGWYAYCGGWSVGAYSVTHPYEWSGGHQVFSRNS